MEIPHNVGRKPGLLERMKSKRKPSISWVDERIVPSQMEVEREWGSLVSHSYGDILWGVA